MHLRKIKLSGFKSFVEPTTLIVPGNLVGVVGPNGCGKSNIIDAVTWVMGESSAKHLRGEALIDVIFNGSNTRQPVSQAAVELVFDNTDGKAGGEYAAYNEIAIRRQINREGVSTYWLNGTRCRRKDIQGLFLGTGLGPRSYSIIEQGMISRLIEARPDDLRIYIEEAAGISKYRERRRETENRMRHTRENLERLTDIREELEKQLNHLQRQARAAERYQVLKQEERRAGAELLALNWRDLKAETRAREDKVSARENQLQQRLAELRRTESDIEGLRQQQTEENETFNQVQSDYYRVAGDISQLEQKIQHTNERITAIEEDREKTLASVEEIEQEQQQDQRQLSALAEQVAGLEPELQGSRSESNHAYDYLNEAEQAMQSWQSEWDSFQETSAGFDRQIDVDHTRLEHLQAALDETRYRRQNLDSELEDIDTETLETERDGLDHDLEDQATQLEREQARLEERREEVSRWRERAHELDEKLAGLRSEQQQHKGRLASLESLQQDALGDQSGSLSSWLENIVGRPAPRLVEHIEVDDDWVQALETVLDQHLQSYYIEEAGDLLRQLGDLDQGRLSVLTGEPAPEQGADADHPRLLDKLSTALPVAELLHGVYVAESLDAAMALLPRLTSGESVVTRDGVWLGPNWLRVNRGDGSEQDGVLAREQSIKSLREQDTSLEEAIRQCRQELESARRALEEAEAGQHESQRQLAARQEAAADLRLQRSELNTRVEQLATRRQQIEEELQELAEREEEDARELEGLRSRLQRTRDDRESLNSEREQLAARREEHRRRLEEARSRWQDTHEKSHEIALQLESLSSRRASLEQALRRNRIQADHLQERRRELEANLQQLQEPLEGLKADLDARLAERIEIERRLNQVRERVQDIDRQVRERDQDRVKTEQAVTEQRTELEQVRFAAQEIRIRLQTVQEQLEARNESAEALLQELDSDARQEDWQEKIASLERKITRLGPINLAAIDEFNQLTERKDYLDRQDEDLNGALTTLENAIRKIDKETRTRFRETFDQLNNNLKETFPTLFGGGHAYLEMTGDDLLETGVAIMARPPGKKNSNIHLLSGGEKALTAIALVFSIFKLNPAPFCILDEVDAPLDDTNTERFSRLLAEMASEVQFLFITHNKITMEIAQQLLGVTMHEPGVSRLVSVDMDEAVKMAASA